EALAAKVIVSVISSPLIFVPVIVTSPAGTSAVVPPGVTVILRAKSGCAKNDVTSVVSLSLVAWSFKSLSASVATAFVHFWRLTYPSLDIGAWSNWLRPLHLFNAI